MNGTSTKLCGVIGDPVGHTLSPVMHNAAMEHLGLDYVYLAFHVKPAGLAAAIEGVRAMGIAGLNVTMPHKVSVIQHLDDLDGLARDIGAVNTIVNKDARLTGFNTDAGGFLWSLADAGFDSEDQDVVLLGAGGAARAVGFALARSGARVTILNRANELDQAIKLAETLSTVAKCEVDALELNAANLKKSLEKASLLVNATSIGMESNNAETPVPAELLRPGLTVFDIVYAPLETRFLKEAKQRGCRTIGGLEMLVRQGALALELWTRQEAPVAVMHKAALAAISTQAKSAPPPRTITSIALIGFMGAGKSSVGRALCDILGKPLADTDALIEKHTGRTIAQIFSEDGEAAFRRMERDVIAEVSRTGGNVIACGGGAVLDPANIENIKRNAVVVYLQASAEDIKKRLAGSGDQRPLLAEGTDKVAGMLAERITMYENAADIIIETSRLNTEAVADEIIKQLRSYEDFDF
ncbi:MAG: shikimate dehydrogenase [Dehalococcoidia bacterium]|nr:shikimate dehydrogenase [Dehalococcoidia bacterium]